MTDKSQLQSYPYVLCDLFNLDDLEFQGLEISGKSTEEGSGGELVMKVTGVQAGKGVESFCMRIINKVSSMTSKGLFICFQVVIKGTMKQHDICNNGLTARRNNKIAAFDIAFKSPNNSEGQLESKNLDPREEYPPHHSLPSA